LYAAFVLVLVLGLRRGEVLGLAWDQIDLDAVELYVEEQLQRVRHQLVRREVKTETSEAPLPLPDLCVAALKIRKKQQDADRAGARRSVAVRLHQRETSDPPMGARQ
jgi:integrase